MRDRASCATAPGTSGPVGVTPLPPRLGPAPPPWLCIAAPGRLCVTPCRPGPKVHRLPRRQTTGSCCLLLSRASRHDLLPGSVASFTIGVRRRLHQTSLWGYKRPPYGPLRKAPARSRRRLPWPRVAYPRRALLTGAVPVGGLAGPMPLWGGHARARTAQPVFCKSHTCPVGTAGAEGPTVGGSNFPRDLAPGFSGPGISPPDHPDQHRAQPRPATRASQSFSYQRVSKV